MVSLSDGLGSDGEQREVTTRSKPEKYSSNYSPFKLN